MIEELPKRIHCLGVGGAGMLPLTLYLADSGHQLTAEDAALSDAARRLLEDRGVEIRSFIKDPEVALVYSSAVGPEHPARAYARRVGSHALRRGECLAVVARSKRLVAVAGSHGKTTTCGMLIDVLDSLQVGFDYLLGAQFTQGQPYRANAGDWLVAEVDESDGTIDLFHPEICVIVNVDHDHHALYRTEEEYRAAFARLIRRSRGQVLLEAKLRGAFEEALELSEARTVTIGDAGDCQTVARDAGPGWTQLDLGGAVALRDLHINRVGRANAANASFAIATAQCLTGKLKDGAAFEFRPIKRRQTCAFLGHAAQVFDDYAHHPREIEAVLERLGAKAGWRTVIVFQPHRYSRTRELKEEFARSLAACERLILLDVYAASETPLPGGTGEDLYEACRRLREDVTFVRSEPALLELALQLVAEAPTRIVFLGAGVGDRWAERLGRCLLEEAGRWAPVYRALAPVASFDTEIRADEPLARKTTLRVGGSAERYCEPASLAELLALLNSCREAQLAVRVLGRGSNLVVPDEGVEGLVLRLSHPIWSRYENLGEGRVRVGAGLRIKALCGQACKEGLEGFEFLEGIPGCVGGVLRMNAGAMGGWISDVLESVRYVTLEGELLVASRDEIEFGYRYCRQLENAVALDAVLRSRAENGSAETIRRTIDTYQGKRKESQPREPSAGCIFKNPEKDSAGRLIESLGLKGAVVGGAEISLTHGNFIINRGGASSSDVIELVKLARRVARERAGVELHPEALLFGSSWEEALS